MEGTSVPDPKIVDMRNGSKVQIFCLKLILRIIGKMNNVKHRFKYCIFEYTEK